MSRATGRTSRRGRRCAAWSTALLVASCAPAANSEVEAQLEAGCPPHPVAAQASVDAGVFGYDRSLPLDVSDSLVSTGVVERHEISFVSPRGGRATGVLWVPRESPRRAGRLAGVVVQHGMPGRAMDVAGEAEPIAARGAVVLALDAPFARRSGPVVRFTEQDSAEQVQLVVDLQRAVDVLLSRPDVDSKRLAYVGVSYGAAMGALVAGVERRFATYVLAVGDGGLVSHFTGADDDDSPLARIPTEQRCRWLAAMWPIEPIHFVGRAPPASILFQSGRRDRLVPPSDATALHAAAREPKTVRWYDADHGLDSAAAEDLAQWLRAAIRIE